MGVHRTRGQANGIGLAATHELLNGFSQAVADWETDMRLMDTVLNQTGLWALVDLASPYGERANVLGRVGTNGTLAAMHAELRRTCCSEG